MLTSGPFVASSLKNTALGNSLSALHHSGYSVFSPLMSGHFSPFLQTLWPLLYRESHWVVTSQLVANMQVSTLEPSSHQSSFPLSREEVSILCKCSRYHSLSPSPTLPTGLGWPEVVPGVYARRPGTLKLNMLSPTNPQPPVYLDATNSW